MLPDKEDLSHWETLIDIASYLRSPQGCPWDREQTHRSMRDALLEETYEVLEAIDAEDSKALCAELGDLLYQVVFNAEMARERGEFDMGDVIHAINTKLIRRHPHVFGGEHGSDAQEVIRRWEEIKQEERNSKGSALDGVPRSMPALSFSEEIQGRAARLGFDWDEDKGLLDKLSEEASEFMAARTIEEQEAELGDILFALVNLARRHNLDAESALRGANQRFLRRFSYMEEKARSLGKSIKNLSPEEKGALWEEAKGYERESSRGERI